MDVLVEAPDGQTFTAVAVAAGAAEDLLAGFMNNPNWCAPVPGRAGVFECLQGTSLVLRYRGRGWFLRRRSAVSIPIPAGARLHMLPHNEGLFSVGMDV